MYSVTCLFKVKKVTLLESGVEEVTFQAEYDDDKPEEQSFSKYTPDGSMFITVTSPEAIGIFRPGQKHYITIGGVINNE